MAIRWILAIIVGTLQSGLAVIAIALAFMFYINLWNVQTILDVPAELLPFTIGILTIFGLFSIVSGCALVQDGFNSHNELEKIGIEDED